MAPRYFTLDERVIAYTTQRIQELKGTRVGSVLRASDAEYIKVRLSELRGDSIPFLPIADHHPYIRRRLDEIKTEKDKN